jgi:hypothetical protein
VKAVMCQCIQREKEKDPILKFTKEQFFALPKPVYPLPMAAALLERVTMVRLVKVVGAGAA